MERISFKGETFVKASSIARELGYTADYVGQLARGGKIDAQLVGRSWFVNEESIRAHKRDRYRSTKAKSKEAIQDTVQRPTPSALPAHTDSHFYKKASPARVGYEQDEFDVLPPVRRSEEVSEPSEPAQEPPRIKEQNNIEEGEPHEDEDTTTYRVPLRRVQPPVRSSHKKTLARRRAEERMQQRGQTEQTPERPKAQPKKERTNRTSGTVAALLCVALVGLFLFVGVEKHIQTDSAETQVVYRFNFATALEALKNR